MNGSMSDVLPPVKCLALRGPRGEVGGIPRTPHESVLAIETALSKSPETLFHISMVGQKWLPKATLEFLQGLQKIDVREQIISLDLRRNRYHVDELLTASMAFLQRKHFMYLNIRGDIHLFSTVHHAWEEAWKDSKDPELQSRANVQQKVWMNVWQTL